MRLKSLFYFGISVALFASGGARAATIGSLSDNFDAAAINASNWNVINADFEAGSGTYTADQTSNPGRLTISGTNDGASFWGGTFLETVDSFDSSMGLSVTVDRHSIAGAGTARRSSLWIENFNGTYLQFAQNVGENGWQYNPNNTGGGTNIGPLDPLDGNLGLHQMQLGYFPLGGNDAVVTMSLDGQLAAAHIFNGNWDNGQDLRLRLGGLARAAPGDTVDAQFDNFNAQSFAYTPASTTQNTATSNTGFTVSNSDILEGLTPTISGAQLLNDREGLNTDTTGAALTNGTYGPPGLINNPGPNPEMSIVHSGTTLAYDLDLSGAPNGYDILSIETFSGWRDAGRDNQDYAVLYETVDNPGILQPLDTVSFDPGAIGSPAGAMVEILDASGDPLITNASSLLFAFGTVENGYVGFQEIDVFGRPSAAAAVPEPASIAIWSLIGMALAGFGYYRSRRKK